MLYHMLELKTFVKCEKTLVKYFTTSYRTAEPTEIKCLGQPNKGNKTAMLNYKHHSRKEAQCT